MDIRITDTVTPLERVRYEFYVTTDTNTILVRLALFCRETRNTTRHRIYTPTEAWALARFRTQSCPIAAVVKDQPPVPPHVHEMLRREILKRVSYAFATKVG